ncbi:MAG: WG repeat-containing protein [Myxococcales bacterium]|nr:WG repeat-containing protein [Myxococcales bacterium]
MKLAEEDAVATPEADPPLPFCAPPPATAEARIPMDVAGKWGFARGDGTTAIEARYDEVETFSGGLARVRVGRDWGMVDVDGEVRVPLTYAAIGERTPVTWARDHDRDVAVIDTCGQVLIPGPFIEVASVRDARVVAIRRAEPPIHREYALLDLAGTPRIPWGPEKIFHKYDGLVRVATEGPRSGDRGWRLTDRDGVERFVWPGPDPFFCCQGYTVGLAKDDYNRECLIDRSGAAIIECGAYADLYSPPDPDRPRLWARKGGFWGLIDFSEGTIKTVVPHTFSKVNDARFDGAAKGMTWATADKERVLFDIDGVERAREQIDSPLLEFGELPADCGGLVRWENVEAGERPERMSDGIDTFTAMVPYSELRLLDDQGKVRRKAVDGAIVGDRWLFARGRLRDVCGELPAPRGRWRKVSACTDNPTKAFAIAEDGVALLDLTTGAPIFTSKEARAGGCDDRSVLLRTGRTVGLTDFQGRVLVPQRFHDVDEVTIDGVELYKLDYFGAEFYRDAAHVDDLGGRRPPGEFPETAEREIPPAELRKRDRATLERMLIEMHARYGYRVPDEHLERFEATDWYKPGEYDDYDDPQPELLGPIERINAARIEAALRRAR